MLSLHLSSTPIGDWGSEALTGGLSEDVADLVDLFFGEVAGSAVDVHLSDLAGEDGETSADSLDNAEGEADLVLSVDVGVHHTEKVLELGGARQYKSRRLLKKATQRRLDTRRR